MRHGCAASRQYHFGHLRGYGPLWASGRMIRVCVMCDSARPWPAVRFTSADAKIESLTIACECRLRQCNLGHAVGATTPVTLGTCVQLLMTSINKHASGATSSVEARSLRTALKNPRCYRWLSLAVGLYESADADIGPIPVHDLLGSLGCIFGMAEGQLTNVGRKHASATGYMTSFPPETRRTLFLAIPEAVMGRLRFAPLLRSCAELT